MLMLNVQGPAAVLVGIVLVLLALALLYGVVRLAVRHESAASGQAADQSGTRGAVDLHREVVARDRYPDA